MWDKVWCNFNVYLGMIGLMLSCPGTATDLLDIPRQMTCMNPACTCRIE